MERVLFIAADSARSGAYGQALAANDLNPGQVLIYGLGQKQLGAVLDDVPNSALLEVYVPDLSITIEQTCIENSWPHNIINVDNVNDTQILDFINQGAYELVIYSGFGSQIVRTALLDTGIPFLHMHTGRLPKYRGSTTVYYSILEEAICSVTAILLEPQIDKGPIIATKTYPAPNRSVNIDYLYDNAIRADLLVEVISYFKKHGELPIPLIQEQVKQDEAYYIIHPLLKHIVLLSLSDK